MDARKAIGLIQPDDDWNLKPDQHANLLPDEAAPLVTILRSSKINPIITKYKDANKKAKYAQKKYKSTSLYKILSASAAALIGAVLLFFKSSSNPETFLYSVVENYEAFILFAEAVALGLATYFYYLLKHQKYFFKWMNHRAESETNRIQLFNFVCLHDCFEQNEENGIGLYQLQLEYFRKYQLEVQLRYYKGRSEQHAKAASKFISVGGGITFFIVLASAMTGVFNDGEVGAAFALIGIAAPIILSAHGNLKLISQDERNALRYANTYSRLLDIEGDISDVRNKLFNGDRDELIRFVNSVNNEISVEHREWIKIQDTSERLKLNRLNYLEDD